MPTGFPRDEWLTRLRWQHGTGLTDALQSTCSPGALRTTISCAVALGVLLDTLIVRSVLVTALNLDLGGKIWWPSKLDSADTPLTESETEAPLETVH
jgi:hypothetical protein